MRLALLPILLLTVALPGCAAPGSSANAATEHAVAAREPALARYESAVLRHFTAEAVAELERSPLVVRRLTPGESTRGELHRAEYDRATMERRIGAHLLEREDVVVERAIFHESIHHLVRRSGLIDAGAFERALDEPYNAGFALWIKVAMTTYGDRVARAPDEKIAVAAELLVYRDRHRDVSPSLTAAFASVLRFDDG